MKLVKIKRKYYILDAANCPCELNDMVFNGRTGQFFSSKEEILKLSYYGSTKTLRLRNGHIARGYIRSPKDRSPKKSTSDTLRNRIEFHQMIPKEGEANSWKQLRSLIVEAHNAEIDRGKPGIKYYV